MTRTETSSRTGLLSRAFWSKWSQSGRRVLILICSVVAGVCALYMLWQRFTHLHNGLQYDELYSAITASPAFSLPYVWKNMLLQDINAPLFNVLLWFWNRIFPFSPFWMHLFSALWGALTLVIAWFCAPKYWSLLKKWIFVTLMSGAYCLVAYGSIIRTYSLAVLFSTVFSLFALRLVHQFSEGEKPAQSTWLVFLGAGLLGSYSHFFCAGVFFIAALMVFLYACYYKVGRKWSFWGTAVVFCIWVLWLLPHVGNLGTPGSSWWFITPLGKASYDILVFLFGSLNTFTGLLYGAVLALVSLIFTYKKSFFKQADVVIPLAQILLLVGVVAVVSLRFNLWLDRYFLPAMPCAILLFSEFLEHLRKRHIILLILWPLLLVSWINFYWKLDYLYWPEYTGLRYAFEYLTSTLNADKVLVDMDRTGYPEAALAPMFEYYIPEGKKLEVIRLTPENAPMSWESSPKIPVLLSLCSQVHLIYTSLDKKIEVDGYPLLFGKDICVFQAQPSAERLYQK
ncbi:MAG: hypothetical protein IKO35_02260 [Elusimicrobiaceae bacterium]|nr:hypothetical protein [Elusimicrobiaceae bacterium]